MPEIAPQLPNDLIKWRVRARVTGLDSNPFYLRQARWASEH
jgi:hypothetical protein